MVIPEKAGREVQRVTQEQTAFLGKGVWKDQGAPLGFGGRLEIEGHQVKRAIVVLLVAMAEMDWMEKPGSQGQRDRGAILENQETLGETVCKVYEVTKDLPDPLGLQDLLEPMVNPGKTVNLE